MLANTNIYQTVNSLNYPFASVCLLAIILSKFFLCCNFLVCLLHLLTCLVYLIVIHSVCESTKWLIFLLYIQLQELKQRASGNMDEPFLNPGINEKQPLHVLMVRFD